MRIRDLPLPVLAATALVIAPAFAQGNEEGRGGGDAYGVYVGFGIGQFNYMESGLRNISPPVVHFRLGAYLSPHLAIEGRVGSGGTAGVDVHTVEVRDIGGVYLKGLVPVTRGLSVYGLAGVTVAQLYRNYGTRQSGEKGFSYGVGAEYRFPNHMVLNTEFARMLGGTNVDNGTAYSYDSNMASMGLAWHF